MDCIFKSSTHLYLEKFSNLWDFSLSGMIRFQVTAFSRNASIFLHYRPLIGLCILQDLPGKTVFGNVKICTWQKKIQNSEQWKPEEEKVKELCFQSYLFFSLSEARKGKPPKMSNIEVFPAYGPKNIVDIVLRTLRGWVRNFFHCWTTTHSQTHPHGILDVRLGSFNL